MNPPARRLYNLSLLLDCLGLVFAFGLAASDPADPAGWWWGVLAFALIFLAYTCLDRAGKAARP
jgi:hypothetical protein